MLTKRRDSKEYGQVLQREEEGNSGAPVEVERETELQEGVPEEPHPTRGREARWVEPWRGRARGRRGTISSEADSL